jgi:hypothetical protein
MSKGELVDIRVLLEGDNATKFLAIKKSKGVSQNTEVIRSIINDFFNEHEAVLSKFFAEACKEA